jgi:hypothetical protein
MSRYLCLFAYNGVQHILCCVFVPWSYVAYLIYANQSYYEKTIFVKCNFTKISSRYHASIKDEQKHNTICVEHHYRQTNTNNVT